MLHIIKITKGFLSSFHAENFKQKQIKSNGVTKMNGTNGIKISIKNHNLIDFYITGILKEKS